MCFGELEHNHAAADKEFWKDLGQSGSVRSLLEVLLSSPSVLDSDVALGACRTANATAGPL